MEDNERTEETIKQALTYRAEKHGGSTTQQWSKIMEESNKNKNRVNSRNKMLAVAASVLGIALVASIVFSVSQTKETKTADKGERVSTSTTAPLNAEQELLKDTILIKQVNQRTAENGDVLYDWHAADGLTGKVDVELTKLINDQNFTNPQVTRLALGTLGITSGLYAITIMNLKAKTASKVIGASGHYGNSPQGDQVAYKGCNESEADLIIKNVENGKVRTIKPESYKLEDGNGSSIDAKIYVSDFVWVDSNTAIIGIVITETNGIEYHLVDLSKTVSLKSLVSKTPITGGSDGFPVPVAAARFDGQVYLLMSEDLGGEEGQLFARTLESENKLWSTPYGGASYGEYSFGSTPDVIYGTQNGKAFIFDGKSNKTFTPEGSVIIKK